MDPLRQVLPTSGELPQPRGSVSVAGQLQSLPAGARASVEVLARLGANIYLARSAHGSAFVASAESLVVGTQVDVRVVAPGAPAALRASSAASNSGDLSSLLTSGATVAARYVHGRGSNASMRLEGIQLPVRVEGAPAPPAGSYAVERAAQPLEVRIEAPLGTRPVSPPNWYGAFIGQIERFDGRVPGPGELLGRLAHVLRERNALGGTPTELEGALERRLAEELAPPKDGRALAARLLAGGMRFEARLAAAFVAARDASSEQRLDLDLRSVLARALGAEQAGPVRDAVVRALEGLAAHALIAAANTELNELPWTALALRDGDRTTTAWMRWRGERKRADGGTEPARAVVAVEFSGTGPVRIDAVVARERVLVRFSVARPDVLEAVRAATDDIVGRLAFAGRPVLFGAALEDESSLRVQADTPPSAGPRGLLDLVG